jgi:hypothetical protein
VSASRRAAADVLAQVRGLGPFFAVVVDPPDDDWVRFADFAVDRGSVATEIRSAGERLAARSGGLGAIDWRAAASVWHLGLVARVVSPALGAAALTGFVPRLDRLLWRPFGERPELAVRTDDLDGIRAATAAAAADALLGEPVRRLARPLTETTATVARVSGRVLWGNVWSALAGAAAAVAIRDRAAGVAATTIVRAALAAGRRPLAGGYVSRARYRRETCCLYYRLPGGGLCGDCVLRRVPAGRR